jgi:hypothetical protein
MIRKTKGLLVSGYFTALRIALIFLFLTVFVDSTSRLYYIYSPIDNWIKFQSVSVEMRDGEAVVAIRRTNEQRVVTLFHRVLLISYPEARRTCAASEIAVIDDPEVDVVYIPMRSMLNSDCPVILEDGALEGELQVSYIFSFPYGVVRAAVERSNPFTIEYTNGRYVVSQPQHPASISQSPDQPSALGLLPRYNEQFPGEKNGL